MANSNEFVSGNTGYRPQQLALSNAFGSRRSGGVVDRFGSAILKVFGRVADKQEASMREVMRNSTSARTALGRPGNAATTFMYGDNNIYFSFVNYSAGNHNKPGNLMTWRQMGMDMKVGDVLDDICDACHQPGPDRRPAKLEILSNNIRLNQNMVANLEARFNRFVNLFKFQERGWGYYRSFLVDAEICWELVTDPSDPRRGIIGVKRMMPENVIVVRDEEDVDNIVGFCYHGKSGVDVPMLPEQVVYVGSGIWTEGFETQVPFIHRAMKVWRQLNLMEDASVIYRIVRAPERRIFTIDIGDMSKTRGEEYIKAQMSQYQSKKVYDPKTGQINQQYNPISMSEDYWFAARNGNSNTKVDTLQGGKNLGEIEDIEYFSRLFYKAMKVPTGRDLTGKGGGPTQQSGMETQRDEIKFSRMTGRIKEGFGTSLYKGFITDLILCGMWDQYGLSEEDMAVTFTDASHYKEFLEMEILNLRVDTYSKFKEDEYLHKEWLARRVLKMTAEEIEENDTYKKRALAKGAGAADAAGGTTGGGGAPVDFGGGGPGGELPAEDVPAEMDLASMADAMPEDGAMGAAEEPLPGDVPPIPS